MKQLFSIIVALAMAMSVHADDYTFLTFEKQNGSTESITAVGTVITFSDGLLQAVNGTESRNLSLEELVKMYFSNESSFLMGDVNDDGELSVADITLIVGYILGNIQIDGAGIQLIEERGDLDGNGELSVADVSILVGLILNS